MSDSVEKIKDFRFVYQNSKKWRTANFLLHCCVEENPKLPYTPLRFAVVASKKGVNSRAVLRNRAKRRIKQAIRPFLLTIQQQLKEESPQKQVQLVFLANRHVLESPWEDLLSDVAQALQRFHLCK